MKIYIWGLGKGCERVLDNLKEDIEVLGFIDNNPAFKGKEYKGKKIIAYKEIQEDFDYFIISIIQYEAVLFQLKEQVNSKKIICYYSMEHCYAGKGNLLHAENWKIDLLENRLSTLEKKMNIRMSNIGYEIADKLEKQYYQRPIVKSGKEAIKKIIEEKKSLIRFGDGEFEIMAGKNRPIFQKYDKELSERLRNIIQTENDEILIAIANNYGDLDEYTEEVADAIREYMTEEVRAYHSSILKQDKVYYDAYMFKSYYPYRDKGRTAERVALIKRIWDQRDIVIIEGEMTRTGQGNDLLDNARSIKRVLCPTQEAYGYYEAILSEAQKIGRNNLILLVLGPTAKVLAYDLAQLGYQVIDLGQIDMDYEWYQAGKGIRVPIQHKYVSQLPPAYVDDVVDYEYKNQIIARIGIA